LAKFCDDIYRHREEKIMEKRASIHCCLYALFLLVGIVGFGCAQKVALRNAPEVPAAIGEAKITRDQNRNAIVDLEIRHLAPSENLQPPKKVYVVWSQAPDGKTINLGQLTVGADRRAILKSPTPMQVFRILVTAEDVASAGFPSSQIVFSSDYIRTG
jgi:hypothetical protein